MSFFVSINSANAFKSPNTLSAGRTSIEMQEKNKSKASKQHLAKQHLAKQHNNLKAKKKRADPCF